MAATTRFAAAISALSVLSAVSAFPEYPACKPTTTTVYTTVTVPDGWIAPVSTAAAPLKSTSPNTPSGGSQTQEYTPPTGWSYPGVSLPTFSPEDPNPNGPFYNPNNWVPEPITWPGKPSKGQVDAPPIPSGNYNGRPRPWGGFDASKYDAPHWCKKGSNLKPELSQQDTNGNSQWGLIDCPRLPPYLGPDGGSVSASKSSSGAGKTSSAGSGSSSGATNSLVKPSVTSSFAFPSASGHANSSKTISDFSSSKVSSSFISSITSASFSDKCVVNDTSAACGKMPDTGVVRKYNFDVAYKTIAPDGVQRNSILVNGQFPGPLIEANWGDWIEVTVHNSLPDSAGDDGEPTALHWHGLLQQETPFYDGVPSVHQNPIAPGKSLTYKFRADHYGTSWYHSHYSAQYAGGAYGPIVIHGPATACYDEDIGPVLLSDLYHKDYFSMLTSVMNGTIPLSNNALINGKMNYPCANTTAVCTPNAGISKFSFESGKKYRLRLINTASEATMKFTIDGHKFTVFANDFQAVKPYTTSVITLAVGQRTDIVVEAVGQPGDSFFMRSEMGNVFAQAGCSFTDGVSTQALAGVYYKGADTNALPTSQSGLSTADLNNCAGDPLAVTQALCPVKLADDFETLNLDFRFQNNGTNFVWLVNNQTFRANMNVNLMANVLDGNKTFAKEWNVYEFKSKKPVRVVMNNFFQAAHPMHLHGHDFSVLNAGAGTWDGSIINAGNTQVRDVQTLNGLNPATQVPSFLVIQFNQDNPGIWPLHCHIAWHVSQGLYINVLERPDDFDFQLPAGIKQTKIDYDAWTSRNAPLQIDSGV